MHPSQVNPFRKAIIVQLTILFGGALLVFTANANLDLLKSVYPNPEFYMFGLLAFEGGVVYWIGYYLLNPNGIHKALAICALSIDALISGVGFFYEMSRVTNQTVSLPNVIYIIGFAVVFNVAMSLVCHLIPDNMPVPTWEQVKDALPQRQQQVLTVPETPKSIDAPHETQTEELQTVNTSEPVAKKKR